MATLQDENAAIFTGPAPGREVPGPVPVANGPGSPDEAHRLAVAQLRQQLGRAQERISEYEGSTSWRVTAPMRALGQRIRGWRRADP